MRDLHVYRDGYSTLPKMNKISSEEVFILSRHRWRAVAEKTAIRRKRQVEFVSGMSPDVIYAVQGFITAKHPANPVGRTLASLAMQIPEDIVVHRIDGDRDWMAYGHLCLPSGWDPAEKIGKSFAEIHEPVPGMRSNRALVESMVYSGPFERYVWSAIFEDRLDSHPSNTFAKFDKDKPVLFVKVERQTIYGMPALGAAVFVLQQFLLPEKELDHKALHSAILGMTPEQTAYKGMQDSRIPLLAYLEKYL